jgi:hypothetical protein
MLISGMPSPLFRIYPGSRVNLTASTLMPGAAVSTTGTMTAQAANHDFSQCRKNVPSTSSGTGYGRSYGRCEA